MENLSEKEIKAMDDKTDVLPQEVVDHILDINTAKAIENTIKKLPKADICFLFKVLDPLERKGHKFSEMLITKIKSNFLVVSFSIKTISNKKMNQPRRIWFELMLKRLNYHFKVFKTSNEIYYIIKKTL